MALLEMKVSNWAVKMEDVLNTINNQGNAA